MSRSPNLIRETTQQVVHVPRFLSGILCYFDYLKNDYFYRLFLYKINVFLINILGVQISSVRIFVHLFQNE